MSNLRKLRITLAGEDDRSSIYALRHAVYATELRQHPENAAGQLTDALDASNIYILASMADKTTVGFISVTPPGGNYSFEKYLSREQLPFAVDNDLYEARLLAVDKAHRGGLAAPLLLYAALRWVESQGGRRIVGIGRREVVEMYTNMGFQLHNRQVQSGAVAFELMSVSLKRVNGPLSRYHRMLQRLEANVDWQMGVEFRRPVSATQET
jgi:GNAT superfamily N-acetyltransferase